MNFLSTSLDCMHNSSDRWIPTCLVLMMCCTLGCGGGGAGDAPDTYPVSGTVTFDGNAIKSGRIQFRSSDGKGKAYSVEIEAGEFELKTETGEMSVEITASREVPGKFGETASPDEEPQPLHEMFIPEIYNQKTTLKETVTADGENKFSFDLKSDKSSK